ncbi:MAG: cytochrome c [Aquificota bacterium]|nr:cytochrome c [Aquificota bacterium]MDQ7082369.1 cytochrome c [Aquificota bacterium]
MLALLLMPFFVFGAEGFEVYKRYCSSCHSLYPPPLKAPPMSMVAYRVKLFYPKREEFVRFVKDYITKPSPDKGVCMPMTYMVFGVMPPVGRSMSEKEKERVAEWLFETF